MKTEIFDFNLPDELIANKPCEPRDAARLLHINGSELTDGHMMDLANWLRPSDVLVFNDTKVIPARLYGMRGQAQIELTLFKQIDLSTWETLIKNARRLHQGDILIFTPDLVVLLSVYVYGSIVYSPVLVLFKVLLSEVYP